MNVSTSVFAEHTVCRRDGLWIYLILSTLPAVPVGTTGQLLLMKPHVRNCQLQVAVPAGF